MVDEWWTLGIKGAVKGDQDVKKLNIPVIQKPARSVRIWLYLGLFKVLASTRDTRYAIC